MKKIKNLFIIDFFDLCFQSFILTNRIIVFRLFFLSFSTKVIICFTTRTFLPQSKQKKQLNDSSSEFIKYRVWFVIEFVAINIACWFLMFKIDFVVNLSISYFFSKRKLLERMKTVLSSIAVKIRKRKNSFAWRC